MRAQSIYILHTKAGCVMKKANKNSSLRSKLIMIGVPIVIIEYNVVTNSGCKGSYFFAFVQENNRGKFFSLFLLYKIPKNRSLLICFAEVTYGNSYLFILFRKHSIVLRMSMVIVIGPTPPGTGVIAPAMGSTAL